MNLSLVVVTVIVFIVATTRAKLKEDKKAAEKHKRQLIARFAKYYNSIILRGPFRRIVEMYASLSCYDSDVVKVESVKLFEKNALIAVLIPIVGLIVSRDVVTGMMLIFIGYIYYQTAVEKENDKIYIQLMEDCSMVMASTREKYMETDSIPLAVLYADASSRLKAPMSTIYKILTSTDGEDRLNKFQASYPIPIIKTFANTCYIVNENGTTKTPDGGDSFANDMTILRQECDAEIRRLTRQKIAFKSLELLSLVGLIIMPLFEFYLLKQIPGTASLLKGYYGLGVHVAVVVTSMVSYYYITTACRPSVVNQVDKIPAIASFSRNYKVYRFVRHLIPKKAGKLAKWKIKIDNALSSKDMRYIYTTKVVFGCAGFLGAIIILIFGTITIRSNFFHNYNSLSFIPQKMTITQENQIKRMDNDFMKMPQSEYAKLEDADIEQLAKSSITGISDSDANTQMKRLRVKYESYHGAHYNWWWWIVAYIVALITWRAPEISLLIRKRLVEYEATNDVSQLQTMMIVLSETKMDVYRSICWLEKQSTIHRAAIRRCHFTYTANPEAALDKLEDASPINDFKRLVRKLKSAVYTLSLSEAFSDMALDKAQSLTITEMKRTEELELRKNNAKLIAVAPAALALVGTFAAPVLILGISTMKDTLNNLNQIGGS